MLKNANFSEMSPEGILKWKMDFFQEMASSNPILADLYLKDYTIVEAEYRE